MKGMKRNEINQKSWPLTFWFFFLRSSWDILIGLCHEADLTIWDFSNDLDNDFRTLTTWISFFSISPVAAYTEFAANWIRNCCCNFANFTTDEQKYFNDVYYNHDHWPDLYQFQEKLSCQVAQRNFYMRCCMQFPIFRIFVKNSTRKERKRKTKPPPCHCVYRKQW